MATHAPIPGHANFRLSKRATRFALIILTLVVVQQTNLCQSALLTNVYSKKLSKLPNFAPKYLLVANTNPTLDEDSAAAAASSPAATSSSASNLDDDRSATADQSSVAQNDAPAPQSSPLVAAWKSSQQQQPAPALIGHSGVGGKKYYLQTMNGSVPGHAAYKSEAADGEPYVDENVVTDFPNPNINNLGSEITKILKKFFLHGYDKRVRPNYSGPPALVNVSFHIIGISSVDEVQMDFTTDFYFRQKWYDPRLEFEPVGEVDELCVGAEFAGKIWLPDTFFANEKTATFHTATTENTFIRIAHTGRVYRSIRLTVTCSCPMDLQYFPMDRQRCKIEIESYGYNTRDIDYRWERGDDSVTLNTKIELPQFKILGFKMGQEIQNLSSGDYIRLYCEIHFVRSMGYYLIQIYVPASLIVMISWVSFWLHRNATPARVALGVTTVLTMTTLMSSTNAALPKISYIKSIDVFLGTCFVMVFASLLEYASVGYIGKRLAMKRKRLQDLQQMQQHHQKVCVAAAASMAAAANHEPPLMTVGHVAPKTQPGNKDSLIVTPLLNGQDTQTLHRRPAPTMAGTLGGSRTLQRGRLNNSGDSNQLELSSNNGEPVYVQRSAIKIMLDHNQPSQQAAGHYHDSLNISAGNNRNGPGMKQLMGSSDVNCKSNQALLAAGAAIAAAAAQNQASSAQTTEFEVTQKHDMIKFCGITPSAIDKHSRVVFPICFVCFNLMYWIIYGHISQQIEDKGSPLIPFIKS